MPENFSELVIQGPFILVKGFLIGFWSSREPHPKYFFHRKAGIRRRSLRETFSELFEMESLEHLCLEEEAVRAFHQAVEKARPVIGISIKSDKKIKSAEFGFSFEVFNKEIAAELKSIVAEPPEGVELLGFEPEEQVRSEASATLSAYGSIHPYVYRGKGHVRGVFGGVLDFFLAFKRSKADPFILTGEIDLDLEGSE